MAVGRSHAWHAARTYCHSSVRCVSSPHTLCYDDSRFALPLLYALPRIRLLSLELESSSVKLTPEMVTVKRYEKKVHVEDITPSVIEPSFGIGRIMYALFEHNFKVRDEDEQRSYFTLPPVIAPLKCAVLPLSGNPEFHDLVAKISEELTENDVSHKVDDSSGSIGRRYARTDEVAVPFGITIDFDSLKEPHTVTLRERDSTNQIRIEVDKIGDVLRKLSTGRLTWEKVAQQFPKFEAQESKS